MAARVMFLRTDSCTVEPRIQKEASSLAAAGHEVIAFGWDRRSEYAREETLQGVRYVRSRLPAPYGSKLLALVLPLFWIRAVWEVFKVRPNVIHACDLDALIPALLIRPFVRGKVVYDIFDNFAEKVSGIPRWLRRGINALDRILMRRADAVIVTDKARKAMLPGAGLRHVAVIMNVPPARTYQITRTAGGPVRIVYAGNIHHHRGLYLIAEALHGLAGVETIFAGWITREEDRLFLAGCKEISFVGKLPYEESLNLLASADIILGLYDPTLPINALASSNKIFEAMSMRCPVVTNEETTMAPIVREEQCGVLVPYGDAGRLREVIAGLRDNAAARQDMGARGYRAFQEKYNWSIMAKELLSLYQKLGVNSNSSLRSE